MAALLVWRAAVVKENIHMKEKRENKVLFRRSVVESYFWTHSILTGKMSQQIKCNADKILGRRIQLVYQLWLTGWVYRQFLFLSEFDCHCVLIISWSTVDFCSLCSSSNSREATARKLLHMALDLFQPKHSQLYCQSSGEFSSGSAKLHFAPAELDLSNKDDYYEKKCLVHPCIFKDRLLKSLFMVSSVCWITATNAFKAKRPNCPHVQNFCLHRPSVLRQFLLK